MPVTRDEARPVRGLRDAPRIMPGDAIERLRLVKVVTAPPPHGPVEAAGEDPRFVGAPDQAVDRGPPGRRLLAPVEQLPGCDVPHLHHPIMTARGQSFSVARVGEDGGGASVALP